METQNAIKGSELFSDFFKEHEYNLLNEMSKIQKRDKGVIENDMYTSGEFLVFEVALSEEHDALIKLVPDVNAYMKACREQFACSDDENIFNFSLAVDFHEQLFRSHIYYDRDEQNFYDMNEEQNLNG